MHSTLRNTWLIAKRDYLERLRTKAFLVMTLLTPALVFMWAVVPSMLITSKAGGNRHLVVVTSNPEIGNAIKAGLESQTTPRAKVASRQAAPTSSDMKYTVDIDSNIADSQRDTFRERLDRKEIHAILR